MRIRQERVATDTWRYLGCRKHHWNTGAKENQQLNPGGPSNRQKSSGPNNTLMMNVSLEFGYCPLVTHYNFAVHFQSVMLASIACFL